MTIFHTQSAIDRKTVMSMPEDREALTSPLEKEISWMQQMSDSGILIEGDDGEWAPSETRPEPGTVQYAEVMPDGEARMYANKIESPDAYVVIQESPVN